MWKVNHVTSECMKEPSSSPPSPKTAAQSNRQAWADISVQHVLPLLSSGVEVVEPFCSLPFPGTDEIHSRPPGSQDELLDKEDSPRTKVISSVEQSQQFTSC